MQAAERLEQKTSDRRAPFNRKPCNLQALGSLRLQMGIWVSLESAGGECGSSTPRMGPNGAQHGLVNMPIHFHCVLWPSEMLLSAEREKPTKMNARRGTTKYMFFFVPQNVRGTYLM